MTMVACVFPAAAPAEVQIKLLGGAGTVHTVVAEHVMREEAEALQALADCGQELPIGRGGTGTVGPLEGVTEDDVLVTVTWPDDHDRARPGRGKLDYTHAKAAGWEQLLTAARALHEFSGWGVYESLLEQRLRRQAAELMAAQQAQAQHEQDQAAGRRVAEAFAEMRGPADPSRFRKGVRND